MSTNVFYEKELPAVDLDQATFFTQPISNLPQLHNSRGVSSWAGWVTRQHQSHTDPSPTPTPPPYNRFHLNSTLSLVTILHYRSRLYLSCSCCDRCLLALVPPRCRYSQPSSATILNLPVSSKTDIFCYGTLTKEKTKVVSQSVLCSNYPIVWNQFGGLKVCGSSPQPRVH